MKQKVTIIIEGEYELNPEDYHPSVAASDCLLLDEIAIRTAVREEFHYLENLEITILFPANENSHKGEQL